MGSFLRRFWLWLAKNPTMLITLGVIMFAGATVAVSAILQPNSGRATTTTGATTTITSPAGSWTYSQLVAEAAKGDVKSMTISGSDGLVTATDGTTHDVNLPDNTSDLAKTLDSEGVQVAYVGANPWTLSNILEFAFLILLIGAVGFFIFRMRSQQQAGGPGGFGLAKARIFDASRPKTKFADVAGCEEAKLEMTEVVGFLSSPGDFAAVGARIPRGVLLVGPPGTGKTLLAKAVAGESDSTFFSISGSEFVEMFVGVGASRVRDLFAKAKKARKAIIFVDEIDAVGRARGANMGGGSDEREQTTNQLLVEMDGMDTASHVIVIGATNRPDILDPALLRPGRFDRVVHLDRPDIKGRQAILDVHAASRPLDESVSLEQLARDTPGLSGADLANLINEAAIQAARHKRKSIITSDIEEATLRVIAGPEKKSRILSDKERRIIAYHEVGHALVMHTTLGSDPVTKVSIVSRGMALGFTLSNPIEDRYLIAKSEIEARLAGIMGGRAAEALIFNDITSGASNDIQKVTELAHRMVTEWGMSDDPDLGQVAYPHVSVFSTERGVSPDMAAKIEADVRKIGGRAYDRALEILIKHRAALERISERLLVAETIDGKELEALFSTAA